MRLEVPVSPGGPAGFPVPGPARGKRARRTTSRPVPVLSFFTGGGFLDMGFEMAGFDVVWTNELNPAFAAMYEHAMTAWRRATAAGAAPASITASESIEDLRAAVVVERAFPDGRPEHFGMIGGPPCTDFSAGGLNGGAAGKYGPLTRTFIEMAAAIRPSWLVMENVPGLLRITKHHGFLVSLLERLEQESHYAVDHHILNALELGVPQERQRLFVVAVDSELAAKCARRRLLPKERDWFPWPHDPKYAGAKSLPWPGSDPFNSDPPRPGNLPGELMVYPLLASDPSPCELPNGQDLFAPYSPKFWAIPEGDVKRHKSFKRLHRYRYSPTAWYGHNEVHLHPWEPRRLSVREALRIQGVPDTYVLPPAATLTAKFQLVCNGVPCPLAERLAESLRGFLAPVI